MYGMEKMVKTGSVRIPVVITVAAIILVFGGLIVFTYIRIAVTLAKQAETDSQTAANAEGAKAEAAKLAELREKISKTQELSASLLEKYKQDLERSLQDLTAKEKKLNSQKK